MIGVVNTGNASSVVAALESVTDDGVVLANDPSCYSDMDALVYPGQGTHAAISANEMNALYDFVNVRRGKYLGICLGLQLLYDDSAEGGRGIGALRGVVHKLPRPRIGWESVDGERGVFYFCHGYSAGADVVRKGKVTGVQFHPEKSGADGLRFLREWVSS